MILEDSLAVAEIENDEVEATRLRDKISMARLDALLAPIEEGIEYEA